MTSHPASLRTDHAQSTNTTGWLETLCLRCGSNSHARVKFPCSFVTEELGPHTFSARRTTEHFHYRILECGECGQVYSSPVLPPDRLADLYRHSKLTYAQETPDIAQTYLRYLRRNSHLLTKTERALEIGCGSGFFLKELVRFGFNKVVGVEPSEDAVAQAGDLQDHIHCCFFEQAPLDDASFDLICCFQTLDHLLNPLDVLRRCLSLLRPGGLLYLVVHNERALQASLFGEKSPIYDVEHVYLFNPETLSGLCEKAGFQPQRVFGVHNTYPLEYWLRMAPIPAKKFFQRASQILGLDHLRLTIPAGNLGLFAIKPNES